MTDVAIDVLGGDMMRIEGWVHHWSWFVLLVVSHDYMFGTEPCEVYLRIDLSLPN